MKKLFPMIALCFLFVLFLFLRAVYGSFAPVAGEMQELSVDSEGNIYIGVYRQIYKIHPGHEIQVLRMPMAHTYSFFIQDDSLYIGCSTSEGNGIYDLNGNYLQDSALDYYAVKRTAAQNRIISYPGNTYEIDRGDLFSPYEIRCNGEVLFRQATLDFLLNGKIVVLWLFLWLLAYTAVFFNLWRNKRVKRSE